MIVVDTNIIAYRFIIGDKTDLACEVEQKDGDWIVPALWRSEFLNVLATSVRGRIVDIDEARSLWRSAMHVLATRERVVLYEKALECAVGFSVSAYDAQYITLARTLNVVCVTEDAKMIKTFPDSAMSMRSFLAS